MQFHLSFPFLNFAFLNFPKLTHSHLWTSFLPQLISFVFFLSFDFISYVPLHFLPLAIYYISLIFYFLHFLFILSFITSFFLVLSSFFSSLFYSYTALTLAKLSFFLSLSRCFLIALMQNCFCYWSSYCLVMAGLVNSSYFMVI